MELIKIEKKVNRKNLYISKLKVAAYVRVSTDEEKQISSFESQQTYYEDLITRNNNWEFIGIYSDYGISGSSISKRTMFKQMIIDALDNKIDLILTKSISRFSRNSEDLIEIVRMLRNHNVGVFFEEEKIYTLNMESEFLLSILASVAEQEVINNSNHIKYFVEERMKKGIIINGSKRYGYDLINKRLIINKSEARVVRKIFKMFTNGYTASEIMKYLNRRKIPNMNNTTWKVNTIKNILRNEVYVGDLLQNKRHSIYIGGKSKSVMGSEDERHLVKNTHEAIISRRVFEKAKEIFNQNTIKYNILGRNEIQRKFPRNVYCGYCSHSLQTSVRNKTVYYRCSNKKFLTDELTTKEQMIENAFINCMNKLIKDSSRKSIISKIRINLKDSGSIKNKIDLLYSNQSRIIDQYIDKKINLDMLKNKSKLFSSTINDFYENLSHIDIDNKQVNDLINRINKLFLVIDNNFNSFEEFDLNLYKLLVKVTIIGGYSEKGTSLPHMIRFIYSDKKAIFDENLIDVVSKLHLPTDKTYKILDFINHYDYYTIDTFGKRSKRKHSRVTFEIER